VEASAVCKDGNEWRTPRSYLGAGVMEVFDAELWEIRLALGVTAQRRRKLQQYGVETVAVFCNSEAAIRTMAHLELGPSQRFPPTSIEECKLSLPTSSQPRFTGSWDTQASPETKKQATS